MSTARKYLITYIVACAVLPFAIPPLLSGCQFGGKETIHEVMMMEPGEVCEVVEDKKQRVSVVERDEKRQPLKDKDGKIIRKIAEKNICGFAAMPKTVYEEMRAAWLEIDSVKAQFEAYKKAHP